MAEKKTRTVLLALDGSKNSEYALNCKYNYSGFYSATVGVFVSVLLGRNGGVNPRKMAPNEYCEDLSQLSNW